MKQITQLSLVLIFLLIGIPFSAQAQNNNPCGTDLGPSSWLRDFQTRLQSTPRTDHIIYVPLQIHLVGTDEGNGHMRYNTVMRSFCTLNQDFAPANIQFFLRDIIYHDNTSYYDHDFNVGYDMMADNNVPNAINCYIVDSPAGNCGYFFPGVDGIALSKGCTQPSDHTWAHEVGHFLSLPHPFYGWEGFDDHDYGLPAPQEWDGWAVEKMDGSNCQFAADGFCDTKPDYLNFRWSCNTDGLSNTIQHDPNNEPFVSEGDLFMSYSNPGCKARFSDDQIAAMRANIEEERTNLIGPEPAEDAIVIEDVENITVVTPAPGTLVEGTSVMIEWEPIPNATRYLVQINPFSIFSIVFNQFIVDEPRVLFSNLQNDKTFYYRIQPLNAHYTCAPFTDPSTFETGLTTATTDLLPGENLRLYPNPVDARDANLEVQTPDSAPAQWRLLDARGQLISSAAFTTVAGTQRLRLPTANLPAGLYLVQVQIGERQAVSKLVVQ